MYLPAGRERHRNRAKDEALDEGRADVDVGRRQDRSQRPTRWRADGWPKDIEPWVRDFNARAQGPAARDRHSRRLVDQDDGERRFAGHRRDPSLRARRQGDQSQRRPSFSRTPDEAQYPSSRSSKRAAMRSPCSMRKKSHAVPTLELEAAPASIFLEAEDGQLTPPMRKLARKDAAGGAVIVVPPARAAAKRTAKRSTTVTQPTKSTSPRTASTA